jgi:uncharacterized protein (DUF885 family)
MRSSSPAIAALLVVLASAAFSPDSSSPPQNPSREALQKAQATYEAFLERESLALRARRGLPIEKLPDVSLGKAEADAAFGRSLVESLRSVSAADLTHEEDLSLEILRKEGNALAEAPRYYWLTFPITPYTFQFLGVNQVFTAAPLRSREDTDRYEQLLAQYGPFLRAIAAKLTAQAERGIRIPKPELPLVANTLAPLSAKSDANLLRVSDDRLSALPAGERAAFALRVASRIDSDVAPAARSLAALLAGDYAARAPEAVGLSQYPGGEDYYRFLVRRQTTLDVPPEDIHRIGIEAIDKINAELDAIRRQVGFTGTLAEFRTSLRTDPRFYARTPEEVGERLMAAERRILPRIPEVFGRQPKAPFGVKRLELQLEPGMTFGYYQAPTPQDPSGYYKYNGSHLEDRTLLWAGSLIAHELVPGHHFQINLQYENAELPPFRRESLSTAFLEGWGDYASFLAGELGMYRDPYDRAGRLLADAFLTSRLVVDTGMNLLGWSRERAMAYLRENTIQSETEIGTETLRYCCDLPGQALAYKMGMRKFVELREKAKSALGPAYDPRRFHDMILSSGAVPMDLAERKVDWFIQEEKQRAGANR